MDRDCIVAIQDMGAAGLTSSSFEMADRGEAGIELDLDRVPLRQTGMTPRSCCRKARSACSWTSRRLPRPSCSPSSPEMGPGCAVIGRDPARRRSPALAGVSRGRRAGGPRQRRVAGVPPGGGHAAPRAAGDGDREAVLPHREALKLLGSPDLASKRWIYEQYDHMVMADTVQRPGGDAAVVRVHGARPHHRLQPALLLR